MIIFKKVKKSREGVILKNGQLAKIFLIKLLIEV